MKKSPPGAGLRPPKWTACIDAEQDFQEDFLIVNSCLGVDANWLTPVRSCAGVLEINATARACKNAISDYNTSGVDPVKAHLSHLSALEPSLRFRLSVSGVHIICDTEQFRVPLIGYVDPTTNRSGTP